MHSASLVDDVTLKECLSTRLMMSDLFCQNAVSMYCRLGFAVKKGHAFSSEQLHPTWKNAPSVNRLKYVLAVLHASSTGQTKPAAAI